MNPILSWLHAGAKKHAPPIVRGEKAQAAQDVQEFPDLPYCGGDGAPLMADVYRPACAALGQKLPVAIMVHGGGLFAGSRKVNRVFCENLVQKGFLVFALEYRLLDEADACGAITDACAGFGFVRDILERYGGDGSRVCVIGESAGAFVALYATALARSRALSETLGCPQPGLRPAALVCLSGMFYTTRANIIGIVYKKDMYGARCRETAFMDLMDPEHAEVVESLPPVLLTSSRGDFLNSHTLRYAKALERAGHPFELLYYPEGKHLGHAFPSLNPSLPESREVMGKMTDWFQALS